MGIPDPEGDFGTQPFDARKTRLSDIVHETGAKTIHYLYDFGDGWDHGIKLEKWFDNTTTEGLPLLLEAAGRCPPGHVGGALGYADHLDAIGAPPHPEHEICVSGDPISSIPMTSTGRCLRQPSTHYPKLEAATALAVTKWASRANQRGRRTTLTVKLACAVG
ncbi:plasmid pRiA4b ORF-3 family protein [Bradyrhizobium sp. CCBAU 11430]|uniref:plasmid pRiA4b ORF-3 family protein n=1 Tax=Bradyrhizobium sp. CCBAU 11430 TaxID=1630881 RepID=UPI0023058F70|nr:plasmid pRiA4b ORF-3 family protein [Bradyrhizobium sp. CCBAU 11430]